MPAAPFWALHCIQGPRCLLSPFPRTWLPRRCSLLGAHHAYPACFPHLTGEELKAKMGLCHDQRQSWHSRLGSLTLRPVLLSPGFPASPKHRSVGWARPGSYWLNRATVHISSHLHSQWHHVGIWTPAMGYVHHISQHYKPGFFSGESWSLRTAAANLSDLTYHQWSGWRPLP